MGLTLDEDPGSRLPTAAASREKMLPDIPRARAVVVKSGGGDLLEMLLGEDV